MNIADIIGRVRSMQDDMKAMREELEKTVIKAESGAGMVVCEMTGDNRLVSLNIDPSLLTDKKMMEDLIVACINNAQSKVQESVTEQMKSLSGNLPNIPGLDFLR